MRGITYELVSFVGRRFFEVGLQFSSVAHIASRLWTFFAIKAAILQHLSDFHVLFADFEGALFIVLEVRRVMAFSASNAQFARDRHH